MSEVKVTTFSSKGRVTRMQGIKTNKIHHLQSDNQLRAFLLFEWSDKVTDIQESYPLTDLLEVIDEKEDLRLDKFMDKESNKLYILHTNFFLTINENGKDKYVAVVVKNTSELKRKVVIEKLEIERRYYEVKKIDFKIITEKELNRVFCKNIEWVRETLHHDGIDKKEIVSEELYWRLKVSGNIIVDQALRLFEKDNDIEPGLGLYLFRFLIATKKIRVNMKEKIKINIPISELILDF